MDPADLLNDAVKLFDRRHFTDLRFAFAFGTRRKPAA
jgi:hypothetical protein